MLRSKNRTTIACALFGRGAGGVSLPGQIWINKTSVTYPLTNTSVAHEFFHLVQWNYAGFRHASCDGLDGQIAAMTGYYNGNLPNERGAWLMEGSSKWLEKELVPSAYDTYHLGIYNSLHQDSLFSRKPPVTSNEREYGTFVFLDFLQEHLAPSARYSYTEPSADPRRGIIQAIWEEVGKGYSTGDAVTNVLLNPPKGAGYSDVIVGTLADAQNGIKNWVRHTHSWTAPMI